MNDAHNHDTRTIHNKLYNSNVKSNFKKVRKENEDNMESEFRTQHTILNFKFWYSKLIQNRTSSYSLYRTYVHKLSAVRALEPLNSK